MRGLLRDKNFLMVAGCLAVGLLQVRAQRKLLHALEAEAARAAEADESTSRFRTGPQPMRFTHPQVQAAVERGTLGTAFGMN